MILYLDASALVKRYVAEPGTAEVFAVIAQADNIGTGLICRAEVAAAFAKAVRTRALTYGDALECLRSFGPRLVHYRPAATDGASRARADALTWDYGLRGYDAVHLASTLVWQDAQGTGHVGYLRQAPVGSGDTDGPDRLSADLPALLAAWKPGLYDRTPSANSTPRIHE